MIADIYPPSEYTLQTDLSGESEDFFIMLPQSMPRQTDFLIEPTYSLQLWGQLLTSSNFPLYKAIVKLIEIMPGSQTYPHKKVAETTTDESGFYYLTYQTHTLLCYYLLISATNPINDKLIPLSFNPCSSHPSCNCKKALNNHLHDLAF